MIVFVEVILVVWLTLTLLKTSMGKKISRFLPTPFWIYFFPIILSTVGLMPQKSPVYSWIGLHALPAALILMLIGTPIPDLLRLGPKALLSMGLGMLFMFCGAILSFLLCLNWLPPESYRAVGAMIGTWTGGSANLVAVKEVLELSDKSLAPLVIVDTFLSYSWLALLLAGVGWQKKFDAKIKVKESDLSKTSLSKKKNKGTNLTSWPLAAQICFVLFIGFLLGEGAIALGRGLHAPIPFFSAKAWAILLATTLSVGLALTPLKELEQIKASQVGTFLLYMVLATIGAKTSLSAALDAPVFLVFGALMLLIHGGLMLLGGKLFQIPLFLLATGSQANVGGPVSAPIVAGAYRPGGAHFGVLMAIFGSIFGTYIGLLGSGVCRFLESWVK